MNVKSLIFVIMNNSLYKFSNQMLCIGASMLLCSFFAADETLSAVFTVLSVVFILPSALYGIIVLIRNIRDRKFDEINSQHIGHKYFWVGYFSLWAVLLANHMKGIEAICCGAIAASCFLSIILSLFRKK